MTETHHLVVMTLDEWRFALPLESVDRVVRAVEITPLPEAPALVLGVVNVQGRITPAINLRKRCRVAERPIRPGDQFLVAHTPYRTVALVADAAEVHSFAAGVTTPSDEVMQGFDFVRGVVKSSGGLILLCDLEALLSTDEELALSGAIESAVEFQ